MTAEEFDSDDTAHDFHPIWVRPYFTGGEDEPAGNPPPGSPGVTSADGEPGVRPTGPLAFPGPQPGDERTSAAGPADAGPSTEFLLLEDRGRIPERRRLSPLVLTVAAVAAAVAVVVVPVAMVLHRVSQESHGQDNDYELQPKDFEGDATVRPSGSGKATHSASGPSGFPSAGRSTSGSPGPSGSAIGTAEPAGGSGPAMVTGSGATDVPTSWFYGAETSEGGATPVGETTAPSDPSTSPGTTWSPGTASPMWTR